MGEGPGVRAAATLPLFWAGGKVNFQGKIMNWVPLFPNAA